MKLFRSVPRYLFVPAGGPRQLGCKEGTKSGETVDVDRWYTRLSSDVSKAILRAVCSVFSLCLSDGTGYIKGGWGETRLLDVNIKVERRR